MKRIIILALIVVLAVSLSAQDIKISGYGSLNIPTKKDMDYEMRWARVDVDLSDSWYQVEFEYDVNEPSLKRAYGRMFGKYYGGEASLVFGKFLNTIPYLYPGPKSLPVTRYPEALSNYDICATGLSAWYKYDEITVRIAHFNQDTLSAAITYKWMSAFYQKEVGYGLIVKKGIHCLLNLFAGVTKYVDDDAIMAAFVQNHIKLPYNFRLYSQIDFGDFKPLWLVGVNYEIRKNSFVKLFYDTKDHQWHSELTFYF